MHLVHFNTRYSSPAEAGLHPDGFAVLGTFFDNTDQDDNNNQELEKIVMQLRQVSAFNTSVQMRRSITLRKLLPSDIDSFYSYEGSLTTPPCSEIITWIIFPETQMIGPNQLFAFERSLDTDGSAIMDATCRDLQPLNDRLVYASSDARCTSSSSHNSVRPSTTLVSAGRPNLSQMGRGKGAAGGNEDPLTGNNNRNPSNGPQRLASSSPSSATSDSGRGGRVEVQYANGGRNYYYRRPGLVGGLVGGLLG